MLQDAINLRFVMVKEEKKSKFSLKGWAAIFAMSFFSAANDAEHVEPVFNEAAGGESSGGVKWHKMAPIGLPGAKFHAMTGQMEKSHDVRRARAEGKGFRNSVLERADYYDAFEKYNNLTM